MVSSARSFPRARGQRKLIPALPFCHVKLRAQRPPLAAYPKELRTLGDRVRKRRLDLGLRQKDVAEQLGVDEMTINNWERHRTRPIGRLLPAISRFLG